jgi:hypothetical protein
VATAHTAAGRTWRLVLCCGEELLPKHYAEAGRVSLSKPPSALSLSPAVVRELRMALSRRKKRPVMPAGICGSTSGGGVRPPNDHLVSSRASVKPKSWQAKACLSSPPNGAQRLTMGPRLCPRVHRQSRANKLQPAAGKSGLRRKGRHTRLFWTAPSPRLRQVGRSCPQPWVQTPSEPAVSSETGYRLMSSDMSGPLSDKPDGTTPHAQAANTCLPAGERPNKKPILLQVLVTPVPSWPGCGSLVLTV